jgi:hypothetical protein
MSIFGASITVVICIGLAGLVAIQETWHRELSLQSSLDRAIARSTYRSQTLVNQLHRLNQALKALRASQTAAALIPGGAATIPGLKASAQVVGAAIEGIAIAWKAHGAHSLLPQKDRTSGRRHFGTRTQPLPYSRQGYDSLGPKPWKREKDSLEWRRQSAGRRYSATRLSFAGETDLWRAKWGNSNSGANANRKTRPDKSSWRHWFGL